MRPRALATVLIAILAPIGFAEGGLKASKPQLDLRASPRYSFSPVEVRVVAEIVGGDDLEDYHCPQVEWNWGDGARSVHEEDCSPYEPGAEIQRRFTASHVFRSGGAYSITVRLRRASRSIAQASATVDVRAGLGAVR